MYHTVINDFQWYSPIRIYSYIYIRQNVIIPYQNPRSHMQSRDRVWCRQGGSVKCVDFLSEKNFERGVNATSIEVPAAVRSKTWLPYSYNELHCSARPNARRRSPRLVKLSMVNVTPDLLPKSWYRVWSCYYDWKV